MVQTCLNTGVAGPWIVVKWEISGQLGCYQRIVNMSGVEASGQANAGIEVAEKRLGEIETRLNRQN